MEWLRGKDQDGYGTFWISGKPIRSHRMSWLIDRGELRDDLYVLHSCDNRACVNPAHLFLGTNQDNMDDMVRKERQARHIGVNNPIAKLNDDYVREMRRLFESGEMKIAAIARKFGVHAMTAKPAITGKTWSHVT